MRKKRIMGNVFGERRRFAAGYPHFDIPATSRIARCYLRMSVRVRKNGTKGKQIHHKENRLSKIGQLN